MVPTTWISKYKIDYSKVTPKLHKFKELSQDKINEGKIDQNRITEAKMTVVLIDINERLVFDFSMMNHKSLGLIVVQLGSR